MFILYFISMFALVYADVQGVTHIIKTMKWKVNRYNHDRRLVQKLACRSHWMVSIEKITSGNRERFVTGLEQNQHRTGAYVDVQLLYSCTFTESMNMFD